MCRWKEEILGLCRSLTDHAVTLRNGHELGSAAVALHTAVAMYEVLLVPSHPLTVSAVALLADILVRTLIATAAA